MKVLKTNVGMWILVDDLDYEKCKNFLWCDKEGYPYNAECKYLHLFIMGEPPQAGLVLDHVDRKPYNCQRENLRWVTRAENSWNTKVLLRKHRNIYILPDGKFQVFFMRKRLTYHVGTFTTIEEAISARDTAFANYQKTLDSTAVNVLI